MCVRDSHVQCGCSFEYGCPFSSRYIMSNHRTVPAILHQKTLQVCRVVNHKREKPVRQHVSRFACCTVPNVRHQRFTPKTATHCRVDSFRSAPRFLHPFETIRLMAGKTLCSLLHTFRTLERLWHDSCRVAQRQAFAPGQEECYPRNARLGLTEPVGRARSWPAMRRSDSLQ